ncbi:unnamed protein product [Lasius platythorax]|uniref:Uncharacterized protein n=1 Tax=Lasius platythorax TaxID=488582 RepID=A0AAV2NID1_9HYME
MSTRTFSDRNSLEEIVSVPARPEISPPEGIALEERNGRVTRHPSQQVTEIGTDVVRDTSPQGYPLIS